MPKPLIKKLFIVILAILLLIAGYFVLFQKPETVEAGWWDDSWLYRQTVGITNSGTAETDFQVMITLDSATLITANKMQSDCDDIRVTDINGKLISHWIEPMTCNTATTKIWTKVPSISTSGDTVYLYYGNSAVDSTSSLDNIFIREISGVQGAWDMDGTGTIATNDTLADSSGNSNTGTASNVNTTGMAYADSQYGQGVDFDGEDDFVSVADHDSLDMGNGSFTLETWFNTEAYPIGFAYRNLFYKGGTYRADIISHASTSKYSLSMIVNSGGGDQQIYTNYVYDYNAGWHHIIFVRDKSSNKLYIYRNGVLVTEGSDTSSNLDNSGNLQIGSSNFNGSIDNIRIYNTALTSTEITDLYGTGGDRHGYVTTNYPNKSLVRKYSASVSVGSPASEERGPGPVAFWKFDEGYGQTANDSTINANNGTLGGTSEVQDSDPTWQTEDMCVSGKCLKFDGVDDYVDYGSPISTISKNSSHTIEAWIYASADEASAGNSIVVNTNSSSDRSGIILRDGKIRTGIYNGSTYIYKKSGTISLNQWYHVAYTFDTSTFLLYINGVLQTGTDSPYLNSSTGFVIGASTVGAGGRDKFFNGFIDSVKIYPYARTAAQIKADYASRGTASGVSVVISGEGKKSFSDGLVGYWKMDEASWNGTADEVVDASGSGNDGVAVGATGIPTTGAGKFGNGGAFDGVDDYVDAGSGTSLNPGTGNYTMMVWAKTNVNNKIQTVIGKAVYGSGDDEFSITFDNTLIRTKIGNGTSAINPTGSTLDIGKWYHLAVTRNGDLWTLYENGVEMDSDILAGDVSSGETFRIGKSIRAAVSANLNGSIDEVRIYNRALSPGEVRDLYNFAPGPVGWWKMDEKVSGNGQTINDSSGYGNTGTTSSANGTGMDCMVPGKYGSGCEFDGVDDYVNAGSGGSLDITSSFTFDVWIKPNTVTSQYQDIISRGVNNNYRYDMFLNYDEVMIFIGYGAGFSTWTTTVANITALSWSHIGTVFDDSADTIKVYVNGRLVETFSNVTVAPGSNPTGNLNLGRIFSGSGYHFNGLIDDVRIYNYARTQAQIMEDYSAGAGRKQPIGYWKFDEGYGTTANNSGIGGSSLNGTLTNMASPATSSSGWTDEGKMGKGLVFDGVDDYVGGSISEHSNITVAAWVYPSSNSASPGEGRIVQEYHAKWDLRQGDDGDNSNQNLRAHIYDGGTHFYIDGDVLTLNQWTYAVLTFDGTYLNLYQNGILKNTIAVSQIGYVGNNKYRIGTHADGLAGYYFNGSIDDVKIYNYAFTEDEVRKEYNQGALLKLGSTGTDSSGNPDDSASREYCIPGDASTCNPPVGRWDFNEGAGFTVNDISGNNNTGTWSGAGEHWTQGKIGKGGSFNGSDDYVNCGTNIFSGETGTIAAWINVQDVSANRVVWSYSCYTVAADYIWLNIDHSNKLDFFWRRGTGIHRIQANVAVPMNEYVHCVITSNGSLWTMYINGVESDLTVSSGSNNGNWFDDLSAGTFNADIGRWKRSSSDEWFNGSIDQVRIYDYARTPAQVAWDYNRGKPVAHWKFDECQGGTANDSSGNGNDGTITIGGNGTQDGIGTCTDGDTSNAWYNGRTGKYNSGMSFDGSDDWVDCGNDASTRFGTGDFSISAWIKMPTSASHRTIASVGRAASSEWFFLYSTTATAIKFYGGGGNIDLATATDPRDNLWHHVIFTRNGSNGYIYFDGVEENNQSGITCDLSSSISLKLGKSTIGGEYFNGSIDEVKIYNYALTAEQVKMEYSGGAVRFE